MPQTIRKSSDSVLFYAFLALVFWLPLPLGSNRPWAWHFMEVASFALLAGWLWQYARHRVAVTEPLKQSRGLFICLLGFAAIMLLQLLPLPASLVASLRPLDAMAEPTAWAPISIDPQITWIHLRQTLAFSALAFLLLALVNDPQRLRTFAIVILVGGIFQGVYGSLMVLSGIEYGFFIKKQAFHDVATGTYWNRNHLANYLILSISLGTGLLLADLYQSSSKNWRERGVRLTNTLLGSKIRIRLGLAMMVIALVLTKSRMGNTAFFTSLIVSGFIWLWLTKRITKGSIILLVSLILIDTLIVGAWFGIDKVKERLETTAFTQETRDEVNRDTWGMIQDQPLLGSGAGSYYTAFPAYRQGDVTAFYDHAHNDYFQLIAEHGFMGVVPLVGLLLLALKHAIATMRQRKTLLYQAMAYPTLMCMVAMLMHSAVDFNLQIPANAATFVLVLTLAWVVRYMPSRHPRKRGG